MLNIEEIKKAFPRQFPDGSPRCGFSIGAGWIPIVFNLCADIESICDDDGLTVPVVAQIKEKFGGLRFYIEAVDGDYSRIRQRIIEAENDASKLCEDCSAEGKRRSGGWIRTLCDQCDERFQASRR